MHRNQAYSRLALVVVGLARLALPAAAGAECPDNLLECVIEPPSDWLALGSLSLLVSSATGGLVAVAWHLMRGAAGAAHREERAGARGPRGRGDTPTGRPRSTRTIATAQVGRPARTRVTVGPIWSDGLWLRMVTSDRGDQRMEILRPDGWEASDRDVGRLLTEAMGCLPRRRTHPPHPSR